MLRASFSLCRGCRISLLDASISRRSFQTSAVLQRSSSKWKHKSDPKKLATARYEDIAPPEADTWQNGFNSRRRGKHLPGYTMAVPNIRKRLAYSTYNWARAPSTTARLREVGVSPAWAKKLLKAFAEETPTAFGGWFPPEEDEKWQMNRILDNARENVSDAIDHALTRRFMAWALENPQARELAPPPVFSTLESLQNAVDHTHPEEWYPTARMLRRKIHMHVGPTNSGKTHNALRALAASRRGVYASPLRLLAYEIFDRLNNGRIVPLGADPSAPPETFKRLCNLVTGEEVRMISEDANLLSCTVEMIDTSKRYEVAVVDEIQMLSDPERGGAWTAAVLGLHAEEIHLCGEAGAVPLVQEMLKDVGDELIVHRYERLTPLTVASKSLKGDLTKIQKGDCVVSFSRSMLFSLKEQIEEATGMRCAIIYGRLPPEVRSEQAERFNDPDSGYDVLVGSDAIGMGLNLKIKRIVFESSQKWDGTNQRALSLSQLKQIAGRAGRFGMHGTDTDPGGVVTTIHERDLPTVRKAVESRSVPVSKRAILPTTQNMFHSLEQLVRPQKQKQTKFSAVFDILRSTARLAPCYALRDLGKMAEDVVPVIDTYCKDFTLEERLRVFLAPVIWRDGAVKMAAKRFINSYRKEMHVKLFECLRGVGLLEARDFVRDARAKEASSKSSSSSSSSSSEGVPPLKIDTLLKLESLYRVVVVYMWFSLRLPLAFPERERAVKLKEEVEEGIEWTLQRMQAMAMQGRVEDDEEGLGESESEEKDVLDDEIMEEQLEDEYEDEDEDGDEDESGDEAVVVRSRSKEASGVAFTV